MTIELITTDIGEELRSNPQPTDFTQDQFIEAVWRIVQKHVAAEREACAKIAESFQGMPVDMARHIAAVIRSRG